MTRSTYMKSRLAFAMLLTLAAPVGMAAPAQAEFGIQPGTFKATATDPSRTAVTQAGAPVDGKTSFLLNTTTNSQGSVVPAEDLKDVQVDLPPGVIGDPKGVTRCEPVDFAQVPVRCPASAQVGVVDNLTNGEEGAAPINVRSPVYNLTPADGQLAQLGFQFERDFVLITARARTSTDSGVTATIRDLPGGMLVYGTTLTLWGIPADPAHDAERYFPGEFGPVIGGAATTPPQAFFTNPTRCGPTEPTRIAIRSWQHPDRWVTDQADSRVVTGCEKLRFNPSLNVVPSTPLPDAPSGLTVDLEFPQNDSPTAISTPALRDARVTLPDGMTINPASADGLEACSDGQLKLKSTDPVSCPDASKIGTVEATTPVLDERLAGGVFLRPQASGDPASGDMFRIALVLEAKDRGLSFRLPGQIKVDPATGRVVTEFADNPQLPVSSIKLSLKSGARAPLATPASCGSKSVEAHLTSWGGQVADLKSSFGIACTAGLGGFAPTLTAGTTNPVGGAFSPFSLSIDKPDGNAALAGLRMVLPTGLLAHLKGNLGTRVGSVQAFAGPGSNPFMLPGDVYLEGAYGDAPFSLRVVVPAKAGPFDLGEVVVRQKIYVDPIDAHVTVVSDPLPTIVKAVPVRLQRLVVSVDKAGFMVNPTSCAAKTIRATLSAFDGQSVPISNKFQVSGCSALDLEPKLALSLSGKGQTTDGKHPAVTANLTQKPGQANLKKVRVALPLSLALDPDNALSDGLCSFVEGSRPDPKCPASSVVGKATAVTPILDEPLTGPVFFVKNERKDPKSGRSIKTTPKLVIPLVGQNGVKLTLTGESTVVDDRLVTTFDNIPDAPVSSFKLDIIGGKGGILVVSSADICKATQIADQQVDGQNDETADADVFISTPSCPLEVLSKKVGKTSVAVKVGGLSAGKVTVTGRGIRKTTKTIAKSTVATITARRTQGKPGKVTVSFDPAGPAKARKTTK